MNPATRWGAIIVALLGVASLVLGVVFIAQAGSVEQIVAGEVQPLKIAEVDAKYEAIRQVRWR